MDRVKAQELLEDPAYSSQLSMVNMERLLLRAGYPESLAHEESMRHGWDRLAAGKMV